MNSAPAFDFVGDKAKLETLQARQTSQMAQKLVQANHELHEAKQWDRHGRLALHVDTELADVASHHGREPGRAALILPRQAGRERDRAPLGRAHVLVRVGTCLRLGRRPSMFHESLQEGGVPRRVSKSRPCAIP